MRMLLLPRFRQPSQRFIRKRVISFSLHTAATNHGTKTYEQPEFCRIDLSQDVSCSIDFWRKRLTNGLLVERRDELRNVRAGAVQKCRHERSSTHRVSR